MSPRNGLSICGGRQHSRQPSASIIGGNMHRQWHRAHLPESFEVFEERLEVRDINYFTKQAVTFCNGVEMWLELERDFSNKDPNAIKAIGCSTGFFLRYRRQHIGYLESEIAKRLIEDGWWGTIWPQLLYTYV